MHKGYLTATRTTQCFHSLLMYYTCVVVLFIHVVVAFHVVLMEEFKLWIFIPVVFRKTKDIISYYTVCHYWFAKSL